MTGLEWAISTLHLPFHLFSCQEKGNCKSQMKVKKSRDTSGQAWNARQKREKGRSYWSRVTWVVGHRLKERLEGQEKQEQGLLYKGFSSWSWVRIRGGSESGSKSAKQNARHEWLLLKKKNGISKSCRLECLHVFLSEKRFVWCLLPETRPVHVMKLSPVFVFLETTRTWLFGCRLLDKYFGSLGSQYNRHLSSLSLLLLFIFLSSSFLWSSSSLEISSRVKMARVSC